MQEPVIKITQLNKSFGEIHAVKDLDLSVQRGTLFAFLGVNGAGKSTTISMLCGQLCPDRGEITVCGQDMRRNAAGALGKLGVVFQNSVLDQALSVRDNLQSRAALYGICGAAFQARLAELAEQLEFQPLLGRTVGKLSGGQRRRIDIARALLHEPEILILDEPTTGLDPQTRRLLWEVITALQRRTWMSVFLTTHYMEEAADADYVVILDQGQVVAAGTPLALKNQYTGDYVTLYGLSPTELAQLPLPYTPVRGGVQITVPNPAAATALIVQNPALFRDFEVSKGNMDDVFLAVTGKKLTGGAAQ